MGLIGEAMLWTAAALTLVTGWDYLATGLRHVGGAPPGANPPGATRQRSGP